MQLQCLSQRFTYSIERNILERRGPPRGGSSRSGEGSSQARDRVGQAAHLVDPAGGVVVLGEHARVLEVPFSSNLLKAVQSRPPNLGSTPQWIWIAVAVIAIAAAEYLMTPQIPH